MKAIIPTATLLASVQAWWGTGHMLTARVAYDLLMEENPEVVDWVETELATLAQFITVEKDHPFVEAATFADFIKNSGFVDQSDWHFIDTPFFDEGYPSFDVPKEKQNVEWAIDIMRK